MTKLTTLEQIRAKFAGKSDNETPTKTCPKCGFKLTVEHAKFGVTELCENCFEHCSITDHKTCCDKEDYHPVKVVIAGGAIQVREQCKSCGYVRPNAVGGYDKAKRETLPEVDLKAKEERERMYSDQYRDFYRQVNERRGMKQISRRDKIRSNWLKDYNKYLDSPEWREKRALVLKRDGYLCQACLQNRATQVHHKSYQFVDLKGSEPAFDLVAVCGQCHDKIEQMKRQNSIQ